jgi:hypothetical protein
MPARIYPRQKVVESDQKSSVLPTQQRRLSVTVRKCQGKTPRHSEPGKINSLKAYIASNPRSRKLVLGATQRQNQKQ